MHPKAAYLALLGFRPMVLAIRPDVSRPLRVVGQDTRMLGHYSDKWRIFVSNYPPADYMEVGWGSVGDADWDLLTDDVLQEFCHAS